ncbi:sensor histidine kinase [Fibrella forsythiae]|uniref:Histidine kinase n=1 Tax=Fibrella forsythiae TaxID=2817061 RepID=A0ABS3JRJ7_9BACT|nr:histidine kinase [Fibrella forsythiae]MBO0952078.1 histidine kinase [Fibrella forsythiae]
MSKQRIYWFCQIVGWTLLIMVDFIIYWIDDGFKPEVFYLAIADIMLGISLTHLYRLTIQRWNWVRLPFLQLVPRVLASVIVLAFIMSVINLPVDIELITNPQLHGLSLFMATMVSWVKTMLAWVLSYTAYHYVERTRQAEIEKILLKSSIRETEAKVLRSQLNPHFMFNALNSIRALVYENPQKAQLGITQLSNILRNSLLADRRKTVELREEIKTVQDYLALEKVRYEERLDCRVTVDPQASYWQVPPMMLQTLVENAIKHGVSKDVNGGFVELVGRIVTGTSGRDELHIRIRNTGTLGDKLASGGFGLKNTSQRLDLLYGAEAYFTIEQEAPGVVVANVQIPQHSDSIFKPERETLHQ